MTGLERAQLHAVRLTLAVLDESADEWRSVRGGITLQGMDDLIMAWPGVLVAAALGACSTRAEVAYRLRQLEAELERAVIGDVTWHR